MWTLGPRKRARAAEAAKELLKTQKEEWEPWAQKYAARGFLRVLNEESEARASAPPSSMAALPYMPPHLMADFDAKFAKEVEGLMSANKQIIQETDSTIYVKTDSKKVNKLQKAAFQLGFTLTMAAGAVFFAHAMSIALPLGISGVALMIAARALTFAYVAWRYAEEYRAAHDPTRIELLRQQRLREWMAQHVGYG